MTLPIPLDAFEAHAAVIGTTGSGKSTLVRAAMAALLRGGRWVGSIDKKGDQWGVTLAADGSAAGADFIIFGGRRGHVPMAPGDGERIATLFVEQQFSAIFDVSQWRAEAQQQFVADFVDTVFRLNRRSLHLVLDEVQSWIPQTTARGAAFAPVVQLFEQGRGNGIHCLMAGLRVSRIDKTSLSLCPLLVMMATLGTTDAKTIRDEAETRIGKLPKDFEEQLATLAKGEGFVANANATPRAIERIAFPLPDTFDSSRTPKHGDATFTPPAMSSALVEALRAALAPKATAAALIAEAVRASIETARPGDIVLIEHLREEVARLRREKYDMRQTIIGINHHQNCIVDLIESAGIKPNEEKTDERERVSRAAPPVHREDRDAGAGEGGDRGRHQGRVRRGQGDGVRHENDEVDHPPAQDGGKRPSRGRSAARHLQDSAGAGGLDSGAGAEIVPLLNSTARLILDVLVQVAPASLSWEQATTLAGRKTGNGHWYQARNALRANGRIVEAGDRISAAGEVEWVGLDFIEACEMWKAVMPPASRKMLDALLAEDTGLTRSLLAERIGVSTHTNGYFYGGIKHLRDAGVITEDDDGVITLASPLPGETV